MASDRCMHCEACKQYVRIRSEYTERLQGIKSTHAVGKALQEYSSACKAVPCMEPVHRKRNREVA